jgi:hypothetical protein
MFCEFLSRYYSPGDYELQTKTYRVGFGGWDARTGKMFGTSRTRIESFSIKEELLRSLLTAYEKSTDDPDAIYHPYLRKLYVLRKEREFQELELDPDDEYLLHKPLLNRLRKRFESVCLEILKYDLSGQKKICRRMENDMTATLARYVLDAPSAVDSQHLQYKIIVELRAFIKHVSIIHELRFSDSDIFPRVCTDTWCVYMKRGEPRMATSTSLMEHFKKLHLLRKPCNICFLQTRGGSFMGKGAASLNVWLKSAEKKYQPA